ncbi:betaine--homocysteine S-methyltransferase [Cocleimonas flava]|nr:betaine--homocysteine S-methyltransferase [Cocleimonas flava]
MNKPISTSCLITVATSTQGLMKVPAFSGIMPLYLYIQQVRTKTMSTLLHDLLEEKGVLLADGATGSNLFGMGLQTGDAPELWNTDHSDRISQHYRNFVEAGSDIILTNTFGGTQYRMKLHGAEKRVEELNVNGVKLLKAEIEKSGRQIVCAGSMGPTGELIVPLGTMTHEEAVVAFREQAEALKKGGVDVFWIETLSSKEEAAAAVEACAGLGLPIVTTYSIDTNGRTMMGLSPDDIVKASEEMDTPLIAFGSNCGIGAAELLAAVINIKTSLSNLDGNKADEAIIISKANCGVPEYIDGEIVYSGTEAIMADYAGMAIDAGARIIGGCCGTSYNHVAAMRKAIDNHSKGDSPSKEEIEQRLGELSTGAIAQLEGKLSIAEGAYVQKDAPRRSRRRK